MLGFSFFVFMYLFGSYISSRFSLPVPGSIIGLVLVFILLVVRRKVDVPMKEASDFMLRYFALMLVPIGVGVVRIADGASHGILNLLLILVVALVVGSGITAKLTQWLLARHLLQMKDFAVNPAVAEHKAS